MQALKVKQIDTTKVLLVHYNLVKSDYQQDFRVLHTFVPDDPFGQLLDTLFNSDVLYIEVWFADQNSIPLKIEDKLSDTLVINQTITCKELWAI